MPQSLLNPLPLPPPHQQQHQQHHPAVFSRDSVKNLRRPKHPKLAASASVHQAQHPHLPLEQLHPPLPPKLPNPPGLALAHPLRLLLPLRRLLEPPLPSPQKHQKPPADLALVLLPPHLLQGRARRHLRRAGCSLVSVPAQRPNLPSLQLADRDRSLALLLLRLHPVHQLARAFSAVQNPPQHRLLRHRRLLLHRRPERRLLHQRLLSLHRTCCAERHWRISSIHGVKIWRCRSGNLRSKREK